MRKVMLAGFLAFAYVLPESAGGAELKQETAQAFNQYVRVTEDRMAEELRDARTFLWVDGFPGPQRDKLYTQLRRGEIVVERLETLEREKRIRVPNGLIHHWVAVSFVPGVTLQQVLTLLQDYDHHEAIYKPDVLRSRLLNADGNCFKIYVRLCLISPWVRAGHTADPTPLELQSWKIRIDRTNGKSPSAKIVAFCGAFTAIGDFKRKTVESTSNSSPWR